jgi:hypothetical protein
MCAKRKSSKIQKSHHGARIVSADAVKTAGKVMRAYLSATVMLCSSMRTFPTPFLQFAPFVMKSLFTRVTGSALYEAFILVCLSTSISLGTRSFSIWNGNFSLSGFSRYFSFRCA